MTSKEKSREYAKKYYYKHREQVLEKTRKRYQETKENMTEEEKKRKSEYSRKWYLEHKDKYREWSNRYYKNNAEKVREKRRKYHKENKEKEAEYRVKYCRENKDKVKEWNKLNYKKNRNKGIIVWEQNYGEIPKGYVLIHKDNDKNNNDLDNLALITKTEYGTMCLNSIGVSKDKKITETNILIARLMNKKRKLEKGEQTIWEKWRLGL